MRGTVRPLPPWRVTVLAAFVVALVFVPAASGANLVPNPGFEADCAGVPCQWTAHSGPISRDTVNPHAGSASLRVTSSGLSGQSNGATSACFAVTPGATYTTALWYRTSSSAVAWIVFNPVYYSQPGCAGGGGGGGGLLAATADGAWHPLTSSSIASASAVSATFLIYFYCTGLATCPAGTTVNFDDVFMDTGQLAVTLTSFTATRSGQGVTLRWRTATETDTLGYHVYRQRGSRRVRLTRRLIPALSLARGGVSGGTYTFRHRQALRRTVLRYWLVEVARDGSRSWHGPATVARR